MTVTSSGIAVTSARDEGRGALIGYLPAGFPSVAGAIEAIAAMVDSGVDVIEVGLPYSDPVMDGPTIQDACAKALAAGVRTRDVLRTVETVAVLGVPVLVMTYWNPIERYGVEAFAADLSGVGGAGLITPDLIPDEADSWLAAANQHGLDKVFLVSPSSTDQRLAMTTSHCRGFVYATAVMGVTGAREQTSDAAPMLVNRTRAVTDLPIGVGLGVSNADQAAAVAAYADAVIVGSALVRRLLDATDLASGVRGVASLTTDLVGGVRRPRRGTPQQTQVLDRS
jgi:tryptophan synthase alpha chain